MTRRTQLGRLGPILLTIALGFTATATATAPALAAGPGRPAAPATSAPSTTFTVTLVTGDRVTVSQVGSSHAVRVRRGPGRDAMVFTTRPTPDGGLSVTPMDAHPLLAADRLDPRLFDVLLLRRLGYDDRARADLSLLTTGTPTGARAVRSMPGLGITAIRVPKRDAPRFWSSLLKAPAARAGSAAKVWLNGKAQPLLDRSVAQIGAPAAWQAGHTGAGVTLAVLDTGYDADHADLRDAVTVAKDFTGTGSGDQVGHGTHVASIAAGRGGASAGKYTGVAKGAKIAVGKVCEVGGCPEDAILAGMEWAATTGARVVNLSLGTGPTDGTGVLDLAVDRLTAQYGTLFVAAAGNEGGSGTVSSPAAATAALAVASVDRSDAVSDFSSRGPRVDPGGHGDFAVKPDLAAPGEDIVAARAAGTLDDEAVDEHYAALSGTSMAAPHVAGAAAILAGQHPDWRAAELKAALLSTAQPNATGTVYEQGTGRVDLARAIGQPVLGTPGSLSLGHLRWPAPGEPVPPPPAPQAITYSNASGASVTLDIAVTGRVFRASASLVTVPARGTATVTIAMTPDPAPAGLHSGYVTARSADGAIVVRTALGAYQEPASYDLDFVVVDRQGARTDAFGMDLVDRRTGDRWSYYGWESTRGLRLPAGDYTALGYVVSYRSDGKPEYTMVAQPIPVHRPAELRVDAAHARTLAISVDRPDAAQLPALDAHVAQDVPGQRTASYTFVAQPGDLSLIPSPAGQRTTGLRTMYTSAYVKAGEPDSSPFVYRLVLGSRERIDVPVYAVRTRDLAVVRRTFHRHTAGWSITHGEWVFPQELGAPLGVEVPVGDRRERTEYVSPGVGWRGTLAEGPPDGSAPVVELGSELRHYRVGAAQTDVWNTAVFGPAFHAYGPPLRDGDTLGGAIALYGDGRPNRTGNAEYDTAGTVLSQGARELFRSTSPGWFEATVPAAPGRYRLSTELRRGDAGSGLSSRVAAVWDFRSRPGDRLLPLAVVRYSPRLDTDNQALRTGLHTIPIRVERPAGAVPIPVRTFTVSASYDGGRSWSPAIVGQVGGAWSATVRHPGKPGYVSLRATVVDTAGNRVEQTIIDAYRLR